ncbi:MULTISPECIES: NUDIX domain-containing protein [unclassified Kitasatospora]|uniref:NUDIX domain-containing protein n=1 Tax=unclassified Kitasatospora TaxID=2633591 RepID=UPI00070D56A5|nr:MULTISPECIES: NUDIX hydrolase [unclassified Kitasatospora]KQV22247.1 NUDIX hydrolase [Kitasatospora sp. Root107]KRB64644.1 NUDIX hydrolase [Kitasatospora sp. Root187]
MAGPVRPVVKRTARAILLDLDPDDPHSPADILLIKRTRPGAKPYWITPGGGVEPTDLTVVEALHREVDEELGGKVEDVVPAFVDTVSHSHHEDGTLAHPHGVKVQHFFVCRLSSMDPARRHGPEVDDPHGEYEIVRLPFTREGVTSVNVVPPSLRAYLAANIEGVRALLATDLG